MPVASLKEPIAFYPMSLVGLDKDAVTKAVNMGIDSHLQAFTASTFEQKVRGPIITLASGKKACVAVALDCQIAMHELPILFRRLTEIYDDAVTETDDEDEVECSAEQLVRDIVYSMFTDDDGDPDGASHYDIEQWVDKYIGHVNRIRDEFGWGCQSLTEAPKART